MASCSPPAFPKRSQSCQVFNFARNALRLHSCRTFGLFAPATLKFASAINDACPAKFGKQTEARFRILTIAGLKREQTGQLKNWARLIKKNPSKKTGRPFVNAGCRTIYPANPESRKLARPVA
jgi:hypothetical protein